LLELLEGIPGAFDRLQVGIADVGVSDRGPDGGVPEQFLNEADIGTVFQEVSGKRVTKGVKGSLLFDARLLDCLFEGHTDRTWADVFLGILAGEEPFAFRTGFFPVIA